MSRLFNGYAPHKGGIEGRRNGVLVSTAGGFAIAYALWNLEDRGPMFIEPGAEIYEGMIIGAHTRGNDLDVNPAKGKQADQYSHDGKGRSGAADPAAGHEPRAGDRLYCR